MLALSFLLAAQFPVTERILADEGRSDWVIVAKDPYPTVGRGVHELQTTIQTATNALLPIQADATPRTRRIAVIRDFGMPEEAYSIKSDAHGITILGGNRGVLYGCEGFLQDVMGVRWFTRKITRVPHYNLFVLPVLDTHDQPAFEYREASFTEARDPDWAVHNRMNGSGIPLDDSAGGHVVYGRFVHTFAELVPPEKYFKTHPEYFSLANGKRQDGYAQLCLTNPDVLKIVVAKVKEWIRDNPKATIFSVSQNDTYLNCQCDSCKRIEQAEGAPSGTLLRFVNQVAAEIGKEFPNVLIDTLAYQWSEQPPLHERPNKNVRVRIAPIGACFAHPLDGCKVNAKPLSNLRAWSKITKQLYVWHYCTDFAAYLQPLPDLDQISRDLKLFHDNGVVGLYFEGAYGQGGGGDMGELKSYLLARLMWNPNQAAGPIIREFLDGVYGKAATYISAWLDLVHQAARSRGVHATIYDPATVAYFSPEMLASGDRLFDQAESAVKNDGDSLEEVQRARMGLEYVELMRMKPDDAKRPDLVKSLSDKIRRFKVGETSEGGSSADFLKRIGG